VAEPVIVNLPNNGIRLRFDGPGQRLRLIEVIDFSKSRLSYNGYDIYRPSETTLAASGPFFRNIYQQKLFGLTFPGEYIPPAGNEKTGLYVLSYPGAAFTFPVQTSAWSPGKDHVDILSSSATSAASSMAIFHGESWASSRKDLYTQVLPDPKSFASMGKPREIYTDEIGTVKILGEGRLEMKRLWTGASFWLTLGQSTPQDLVAELGPPDAIYRKNDQRMQIHKARTESESGTRPNANDIGLHDDLTDTDQSSIHTATDVSGDESETGGIPARISGECFYNYFYYGFDVLISTPTTPSRRPPSLPPASPPASNDWVAPLVATKIVLHSNVPGSYSFNRHRRCRWEIDYLTSKNGDIVGSELPFDEVAKRLHNEWKAIYANPEEAKQRQRGMVLNRGWGDSPGSSCELLGGWEDSAGGKRVNSGSVATDGEQGLGNTTLYGFPGLVFEVLKNGTVSGLTVF
jgi:hypothetical protein